MANEFGQVSYQDVARREDLLDLVTNISPKDTPFTSGLPVKEATNTLHEWVRDALSARAANAQIEGLGPTFQEVDQISRVVLREDSGLLRSKDNTCVLGLHGHRQALQSRRHSEVH